MFVFTWNNNRGPQACKRCCQGDFYMIAIKQGHKSQRRSLWLQSLGPYCSFSDSAIITIRELADRTSRKKWRTLSESSVIFTANKAHGCGAGAEWSNVYIIQVFDYLALIKLHKLARFPVLPPRRIMRTGVICITCWGARHKKRLVLFQLISSWKCVSQWRCRSRFRFLESHIVPVLDPTERQHIWFKWSRSFQASAELAGERIVWINRVGVRDKSTTGRIWQSNFNNNERIESPSFRMFQVCRQLW